MHLPARRLKNRRLYKVARPHVARAPVVAVAAAEPDVVEPAAEAAAAEQPAAEQQPSAEGEEGGKRQRRGGQQRGQRNKRSLGPARTMAAEDVKEGQWYEGVVVSVMDFGAFVNIGASTDGLLHISQISVSAGAVYVRRERLDAWLPAGPCRPLYVVPSPAKVPCRPLRLHPPQCCFSLPSPSPFFQSSYMERGGRHGVTCPQSPTTLLY